MISKKNLRKNREKDILLALVELYLLMGKPIGSNTLKENRFDHISSATIRNYLAKLEAQKMVKQQHSSGGRIPTSLAYKFYANHYINYREIDPHDLTAIKKELNKDSKEITSYLQNASELLSTLTQGAIFLSSPRFDQDLITEIKLVQIDSKKYLCVLITSFGLVHTEILYLSNKFTKLSTFSLKRIEAYFQFRITGLDRPQLTKQEEEVAVKFYNEILLRHIVNYSSFSREDVYKTGFSTLIRFSEFRDTAVLATGLSIFENTEYMRTLLHNCMKSESLKFWIGNDLDYSCVATPYSTIVAVPYFIHGKSVGAVAFLGPIRISYPKIFGIMRRFSEILSEMVTQNLYKHKITYRQPIRKQVDMQTDSSKILTQEEKLQLEDQSEAMHE